MTPQQLKRGEEIQREIREHLANYPDCSPASERNSFVVNESRIPASVFGDLKRAYEEALNVRLVALRKEFEGL